MDCQWFTRVTLRALSVIAGGAFVCLLRSPRRLRVSCTRIGRPPTNSNVPSTPSWAEVEGQTIVKDSMAGKPERSAMVEQQHQRIMEHLTNDPQAQAVNTGMFNTQTMMHQYGAGGQDLLLMSDPQSGTSGNDGWWKCPATAPVASTTSRRSTSKSRSTSGSIFYPGYMYTLDETSTRSGRKKRRIGVA